MPRILKVYSASGDDAAIRKCGKMIQKYDAFLLIEATSPQAKSLSRKYPVEDITAQYRLKINDRTVNTSHPRITADGSVRRHSAYTGTRKLSPGPHHYIVQFVGPIKENWLRRVRATGAKLRQPVGNFAYVVMATHAMLPRIAGLDVVRWLGELPHHDRIAPPVLGKGRGARHERPRIRKGVYTVEVFTSEDAGKIASAARRLGFQVLSQNAKAKLLIVKTSTTGKTRQQQIHDLSAVHGVRIIRQRTVARMTNNVATRIMAKNLVAPAVGGLRLTGEGEIIGVCDGGLDTGDPDTIHPDFAGRIAAIKSYPITPDWSSEIVNPRGDDGPSDLVSGHGTHVAGSVLGNGAASARDPHKVRGLAYKASLVFQSVQQEIKLKKGPPPKDLEERYAFAGLPNDLAVLFRFAYDKGARIHSNSWGGGGEPGAYDDRCRQFDQFVWDHKDLCFLISAGNNAADRDGDGKINPMSVTSPGTAKNCITVGACESRRPRFNWYHYGDFRPDDFPVRPFRKAPMADDPDQVVAFSGRGPTKDHRIKPDVVAPGTFILSTRSTMLPRDSNGWGAYPRNQHYFYLGGTSMATALTAGAVGLLREFLRKRRKIEKPSAALLKATLVAGAQRLPGTAPPGTIVDAHQGYGRVNLDRSLRRPLCFVEGPALKTGRKSTTVVKVPSGRRGMRIVMCYSDFPGERLINNLSLIVTDPAGKRYVGNQECASRSSLALDATNNLELIDVAKAKAGTWTIDVVASDVPKGPQDFALVAVMV